MNSNTIHQNLYPRWTGIPLLSCQVTCKKTLCIMSTGQPLWFFSLSPFTISRAFITGIGTKCSSSHINGREQKTVEGCTTESWLFYLLFPVQTIISNRAPPQGQIYTGHYLLSIKNSYDNSSWAHMRQSRPLPLLGSSACPYCTHSCA